MNIYRIAQGVYVRTKAELTPDLAALVDPQDAAEMKKAREYFRNNGLGPR